MAFHPTFSLYEIDPWTIFCYIIFAILIFQGLILRDIDSNIYLWMGTPHSTLLQFLANIDLKPNV